MHPPFEPTTEQRRMARTLSGFGLPHGDIALLLDVPPETLRTVFGTDLARGRAEANAKVGQSLFGMATAGGSVAAAIFWMKARGGWREKQEIIATPGPAVEWYIEGVPVETEEEWTRNTQLLMGQQGGER